MIADAEYRTPDELRVTYDGLARIVTNARARGEEMTSGLAALWLQQHEAVNKYVMTSTDRFLNIRGGAGVGKTYFMERLVRASLDAGRPVDLVAPYGEQGRVTLRSEAERLSRPDVAAGVSRCQYGRVAIEQTFHWRAAILNNLDKNYGNSDENGEYRASLWFISFDYAGEVNGGSAEGK